MPDQLGDAVPQENPQLAPLLRLEELITMLGTCGGVIASEIHGSS